MQNIKKTLEMTSLLFCMALLFSFIAWFLGYDGFIIIGNLEYPPWIDYLICPILLCINLSLVTGFTLDLYSWKVLWVSVPIAILSGVFGSYVPTGIFNGPVITTVLIFLILILKKGKQGFIRLGIVTGVTLIFQFLLSMITIVKLINGSTMYEVYRFSISMIILMLLLYSIGGVNYVLAKYTQSFNSTSNHCDVKHWQQTAKRLEFLVFPGRIRDTNQNSSSNTSYKVDDIPVNNFELWVMRSVITVVQIIQWIFIVFVCSLDNYFLDALVITTSFICYGFIIRKRTLHFKPIILCTFMATGMFYIAARFTFSFRYSHFFPIVIGLVLVYTVYRISYELEKQHKNKIKKDIEKLRKIRTEIDNGWDHLDKL